MLLEWGSVEVENPEDGAGDQQGDMPGYWDALGCLKYRREEASS